MTADDAQGALAIWHDIRAGDEDAFEHWYKTEHFPERLGVPGFRLGRRYEAVAGTPRYFCVYLTDTPQTLTSAAYLARLNDPTPMTRTIMTAFLNMNRTVCRRVARFGALTGAFSVTARFDEPVDDGAARSVLAALADTAGVARCELWANAEQASQAGAAAAEEQLRGRDRKISACAVAETLREADAERVREAFARAFGTRAETGIYRLLCTLTPASRTPSAS
jgi:hypothetical protein